MAQQDYKHQNVIQNYLHIDQTDKEFVWSQFHFKIIIHMV